MQPQQLGLLVLTALTLIAFLSGRWRHDVVALTALVVGLLTGLIPMAEAFSGISHPAVITVGCVLILSQGLERNGVVTPLLRLLEPGKRPPWLQLLILMVLAAALSAVINNVGALALLMPLALDMARKRSLPPALILMPLSFATILGGMTTLIGTPPNLIVAGYRSETLGLAFGLFDFTPVGVVVALFGLALILITSRWLVPARSGPALQHYQAGDYRFEVRLEPGSELIGTTIYELEQTLEDSDVQLIALVRNQVQILTPLPGRRLQQQDVLLMDADPKALSELLERLPLEMEVTQPESDLPTGETDQSEPESKDEGKASPKEEPNTLLKEWVVVPGSALVGRTARQIGVFRRYGLQLLALSRQGQPTNKRLRLTPFAAGDVLLLQGVEEGFAPFAQRFGLLPLDTGVIPLNSRGRPLLAVAIMASVVLTMLMGWLGAPVAFILGVLAFVLSGILPVRELYQPLDGPILVLLAALFPLAQAMGDSGAAEAITQRLLQPDKLPPAAFLALLMLITMTLSDFMNNAATAAMMCPIALAGAHTMGVNPDSFLMAVAIGASCAFLTPIGHQNNTLILGPAGLHFGDYWRLGLPLELMVIAVGVPMLLWIWPL
ncbi:SLC13 family permease [Ferrimonas gelatinilytica]|uniref:SLC13 family permease n=1 Tax=Ferrimonas gelatinilytica TaxID=1255257 RepID=A0ABP9RX92_9GAMM